MDIKEIYTLTQEKEADLDKSILSIPSPSIASLPRSENLLELVLKVLDDNLAQETVEIDLRGKSSIADYMVVASGRSKRQVASLSEKLLESLKQQFGIQTTIEGKEGGDWVLIDAGDVIIHLFRPEVRNFYQIEKLWMPTESQAKDNI